MKALLFISIASSGLLLFWPFSSAKRSFPKKPAVSPQLLDRAIERRRLKLLKCKRGAQPSAPSQLAGYTADTQEPLRPARKPQMIMRLQSIKGGAFRKKSFSGGNFIVFEMAALPSGKSRIRRLESGLKSEREERCILSLLKKIRFHPFKGEAAVRLYKLQFTL